MGLPFSKTSEEVVVNEDGMATFDITLDDPEDAAGDANDAEDNVSDQLLLVYTVTGGPGSVTYEGYKDAVLPRVILFSDHSKVAHKVSVTPSSQYALAPPSGQNSNSVTVEVTDQFGHPLADQYVSLKGSTGSTYPPQRKTGDLGTRTIQYQRTSTTAEVEKLTAIVGDNDEIMNDPAVSPFFWVTLNSDAELEIDNSQYPLYSRVFAGDLAKNHIVVDTETTGPTLGSTYEIVDNSVRKTVVDDQYKNVTPQLVNYQDNDYFKVDGQTVTLAAFEQALETGLEALDEDNSLTYLRLGWQSRSGNSVPLWDLRASKPEVTFNLTKPSHSEGANLSTQISITATVENLYDEQISVRYAYRSKNSSTVGDTFDPWQINDVQVFPVSGSDLKKYIGLGKTWSFNDARELSTTADPTPDTTDDDDHVLFTRSGTDDIYEFVVFLINSDDGHDDNTATDNLIKNAIKSGDLTVRKYKFPTS